ncbi:MAG: pyridoxamine 5'-phosphate oxidase family protein [Pseudomonadales bacterium]|nr:pyridoxamine 5'-phosphate oxidase family protein [Pseudomonadales bacterium]
MPTEETSEYVSNYADVTVYPLTDDKEAILHEKQTECTFMWTNSQGEPVGVIMNYVWRKGSIWLTATKQRARIPAIRARPRVAVAITSRGTNIGISQAITYKGTAVLHEDAETIMWMNTELANAVRPAGSEQAASFAQHLANSPGRLAIEVIPDKKISFNSDSLFKNSPTGPSKSMLD